jgi:EAL domain-containing protein (putative c-di-GMP-specific phosphodiesterase class I)
MDKPDTWQAAPDQFISLAERYGVIHKVTRILFCKALDILEELPAKLTLSFNLSSHDIVTEDTIAFIIAEVERRKSAPERLIFELTETALMRSFRRATRSIRRLRALGAKISLDDFGTGYSSLSYLRRLRIDKVKVDRSFVTNAEGRGKDLLAAIKGLCDNLGMMCLIEGIETSSELRLLRELDYEEAQGYLLGGRSQPRCSTPTLPKR